MWPDDGFTGIWRISRLDTEVLHCFSFVENRLRNVLLTTTLLKYIFKSILYKKNYTNYMIFFIINPLIN